MTFTELLCIIYPYLSGLFKDIMGLKDKEKLERLVDIVDEKLTQLKGQGLQDTYKASIYKMLSVSIIAYYQYHYNTLSNQSQFYINLLVCFFL